MVRRDLTINLILILGISTPVLATPTVGVIMHVPKDKTMQRQAELIHAEIESLLSLHPDFKLMPLEVALGNPKLEKHLAQNKKTDALIQASMVSMDQKKYRRAEEQLQQAYRQYARQAAYLRDIAPTVKTLELLGATYLKRSYKKKAFKTLSDALSLNPTLAPTAKYFTGSMPNFFHRVKRHRKKSGRGPITLMSKPSNAMVFMDGKYKGMTPLTIRNSKAGLHFVRIAKRGYKSWGKQVRLKKGKMLKQIARLAPTNQYKKLETNIRKLPLKTNLTHLTPSLKRVGEITGYDKIIVLRLKKNKKFTMSMDGWFFDFKKKALQGTAMGSMPFGGHPGSFNEVAKAFLKALFNDYTNEKHRLESMTPAEREAEAKMNLLDFSNTESDALTTETDAAPQQEAFPENTKEHLEPTKAGQKTQQGALLPDSKPTARQNLRKVEAKQEKAPAWAQKESSFAKAFHAQGQPLPKQTTLPVTASTIIVPKENSTSKVASSSTHVTTAPTPPNPKNIKTSPLPEPVSTPPGMHAAHIPAPIPFINSTPDQFPLLPSLSAGAGVVLFIVGALLTNNHIRTLQDGAATSAEKESARTNGLISLGLTGLGAASTVIGGTLLYFHYQD
jgi:hypothetical protein